MQGYVAIFAIVCVLFYELRLLTFSLRHIHGSVITYSKCTTRFYFILGRSRHGSSLLLIVSSVYEGFRGIDQ